MATTHYIPNASGWASQKASSGTSRAGSGRLRIKVVRDYDAATNKSTLTFSIEVYSDYSGLFNAYDGGSFTPPGSAVTIDHHYYVQSSADSTFRGLYYEGGGTSTWTRTVTHDSGGAATISAAVNFTLKFTTGGKTYTMRWNNSGSFSVSEPRQSVIASLPASVRTQETAVLALTRYSGAFWHKAEVWCGENTKLWTSSAFETSLNITPPRSWFDNYPNDASLTLTVWLRTYTDQSCATAVGSWVSRDMTLRPDAGMAPAPGSGFAAASAYNSGTAASGITGYVQGYSKARVRLTKSALTLANNAAVASYAVSCQGGTVTVDSPGAAEDVLTGVLTGAAATEIRITVTDSRGLTAVKTLSVTPMAYAPPALSGISVFRCDSAQGADEDGLYVSVKATGTVSPLGGQNTRSLNVKAAEGGGYGSAVTLTSGTAKRIGGSYNPDQRLRVLITVTDALGSEASALRELPTRQWAMKFRADGKGVAFGKAPEHGEKKLELPADWDVMFGAESLPQRVQRQLDRCGFVRPNLLDNAYFVGGGAGWGVFPVNQRGALSYTGKVNGFDRWTGLVNGAEVGLTSAGVTLSNASARGYLLCQYVTDGAALRGKTVTLSALINGTLSKRTIELPDAYESSGTVTVGYGTTPAVGNVNVYLRTINGVLTVQFYASSAYVLGTTVTVQAIKLELGEYQTLAHNEGSDASPVWVLNEIPSYAGELAKCQAYYLRLPRADGAFLYGYTGSASKAPSLFIPTPVAMRADPAVTPSPVKLNFQFGGGYVDGVSCAVSSKKALPNGVRLNLATTTAVGSSAWEMCTAVIGSGNDYIELSAEP